MITQIIALLSMTTIATLVIVFGFKEFKYNKRIEFLQHLVDKGYESNKIDLNNVLK